MTRDMVAVQIAKQYANKIVTALTAVVATKVDKGSLRINVADYASAVAAVAAAPTGSIVYFPPGTYVNPTGQGNGITVLADNITIEMAPGAEIQVNTWGQAGIDCYNRSGITVMGSGVVRYTGTRVTAGGGTYRGSNPTSGTAGVYINRDRCKVRGLRTINMPVGVYLSSYNGTSSTDRVGVGNRVSDCEFEGYDFGVLWTGQDALQLSNINGHDDIDDSAGVNPTHVYYCAGTDAFRSTDITISDCIAKNNLYGWAYQLKNVDQAKLSNHAARNCSGLINLVNCTDVSWDGMSGIDMQPAVTTPSGAVIVQAGASTNSTRLKLQNTTLTMASTTQRAWHMIADDSDIINLTVVANRNAGGGDPAEVRILGTNNTLARARVKNIGSTAGPAIQVGDATNASTGVDIDDIRISGCNRAVDFYATGGGTVSYKTAHVSVSGSVVSTASGSPSYSVLQDGVLTGSGTPEGAVTASVGALYKRSNGGASTTLYVKESGTGNTGWVAK